MKTVYLLYISGRFSAMAQSKEMIDIYVADMVSDKDTYEIVKYEIST